MSVVPAIRISSRDPRYFEYENGRPFIPIGLNLCFPRFVESESEILGKMRSWLDALSQNGGNFFRMFLGHPAFDVEHTEAGVYDETKARRVDAVLDMARERGLYVNLCLEHFRSLEEKPLFFPGAVSFGKLLHHVKNGGTANAMSDFWTGEASRSQFKRKIHWLTARWGKRPELAVWELWNEVDAAEGEGWAAWTEEMLAHLKRCLPDRVVTQSLGGWEYVSCEAAYRAFMPMPGNDLAVVHRYLNEGGSLPIVHGPVDVLSADAIRQTRMLAPDKPILLGEGGAVEPHHSAPFRHYGEDKEGSILHDVIFAPFFAGAAGTGLSWHWDFYVDKNDLWRHFRAFADVVKDIDPVEEGFEPKVSETEAARVYILVGKKTILVFVRDRRNDWAHELDEKEAPKRFEVFSLSAQPGWENTHSWAIYDPWEARWQHPIIENGQDVRWKNFHRSAILKGLR